MVELVEKSLECYKQHCSEVNYGQSSNKKVFFHPHQNFTCDKCGTEFQNETAYSYATSLGKSTKTYCSNCVEE